MIRAISGFFRREDGQDLAEYCLITALVALVAGGILLHVSGGLGSLWTMGNSHLNNANTTVENNGMSGTARH
jgi:Flp pilus assembly pilin Flp